MANRRFKIAGLAGTCALASIAIAFSLLAMGKLNDRAHSEPDPYVPPVIDVVDTNEEVDDIVIDAYEDNGFENFTLGEEYDNQRVNYRLVKGQDEKGQEGYMLEITRQDKIVDKNNPEAQGIEKSVTVCTPLDASEANKLKENAREELPDLIHDKKDSFFARPDVNPASEGLCAAVSDLLNGSAELKEAFEQNGIEFDRETAEAVFDNNRRDIEFLENTVEGQTYLSCLFNAMDINGNTCTVVLDSKEAIENVKEIRDAKKSVKSGDLSGFDLNVGKTVEETERLNENVISQAQGVLYPVTDDKGNVTDYEFISVSEYYEKQQAAQQEQEKAAVEVNTPSMSR